VTPAPDPATPPSAVREVARAALGIDRLRPGQREAVEAVAQGRDTLLVMPTGAGKSAVYQVAGTMLPGPTVVVSPLIALQRDQVESIAATDLDAAAAANSTVRAAERRELFDRLQEGELEFLFVAPEQLARPDTFRRVQEARPSLFVVDEAHCVTQWGHDFRPDYLRLAAAVDGLGRPPVLALTATASPVVRDDIVCRLRLRDPKVIVRGFDRPNIRFEVEPVRPGDDKERLLVERVLRLAPPGLVYVATRRQAEELAAALTGSGRAASWYHGGLPAAAREDQQARFMDGAADVMVATSAFGMGIDKADVRFVVHHDVPESLDAYYQEAGRAGRDGEPAVAVLQWRPEDLGKRRFFAAGGVVDRADVLPLARLLAAAGRPVELADLGDRLDLGPSAVTRLLGRLEAVGAVELQPGASTACWPDAGVTPEAAAEDVVASDERRARVEESRLEMMRGYAEGRGCRRRFILTYFGEAAADRCGNCDGCDAAVDRDEPCAGVDPFPEQARVDHDGFGGGLVVRRDGDRVVVLFDDAGYKILSRSLVEEAGVLRRTG
jgi:ATP-dependent DNA helicase RecQ